MAEIEDYAAEIAKAEHKLQGCQAQLDQLEALKAQESKLRREVAELTAKISELRNATEFYVQKPAEATVPLEEQNEQLEEKIQEFRKEHERDPAAERKSKMRALNKKLQQIDKLKAKEGKLDDEAAAKVASEPGLRKKLAALEAGEDPDSDAESPAQEKEEEEVKREEQKVDDASGVELPTDPEARKKQIKALQKKLRDIEQLKSKEGQLDTQAKQKMGNEQLFIQELAALEDGKNVFVYDEAAAFAAHKFEMEKQLKKLKKKVDQIETLKNTTETLDDDAQAKLANEAAAKKEYHDLQKEVAQMDKKERERVAQRLGWEKETEQKSGKKKKNSGKA